jgi:predicted DNA-binding transcriptional regulator AlpA
MKRNMRITDVAKMTGLTLGTCYVYVSGGILPPPRERIGTAMIFDREDIEFFLEIHEGRPGARKSRRLNGRKR